MLKDLVKVANRLDSLGLTKEADFLDNLIYKIAEDGLTDLTQDPSANVAAAIEASLNIPHFINTFKTRNPSPESEGSTFIEPQTPESLASARWEPYNHPDISPPAVAYRANIPGYFGVINLTEVDRSTPVQIVKAHKGAVNEASCLLLASDVVRPKSDFTTILLGPYEGSQVVWTFFPGPPIAISTLDWSEELESNVKTAGDAIDAGFKFGKLVG